MILRTGGKAGNQMVAQVPVLDLLNKQESHEIKFLQAE
jgi:anaphase-promoting complex subunit 6